MALEMRVLPGIVKDTSDPSRDQSTQHYPSNDEQTYSTLHTIRVLPKPKSCNGFANLFHKAPRIFSGGPRKEVQKNAFPLKFVLLLLLLLLSEDAYAEKLFVAHAVTTPLNTRVH